LARQGRSRRSSPRAISVTFRALDCGEKRADGAWGGGLYDTDFSLDLKGTINGVLRAPLSDDEVLAELWSSHGERAAAADALDYWLVPADQLEHAYNLTPDRQIWSFSLSVSLKCDDGADHDTLKAAREYPLTLKYLRSRFHDEPAVNDWLGGVLQLSAIATVREDRHEGASRR
jgi:hypothetical protein